MKQVQRPKRHEKDGDTSPRPLVEVRDLFKVYRTGSEKVAALRGISLDVYRGQFVCILGTSGSGKSTLLNQLAGFEHPSHGSVRIAGHEISSMPGNALARFRQRHMGFVFQFHNLLDTMTALENVAFPLTIRGVPRARRERAAREMLARVGLAGRAGHYPRELSGGQQQRVGIARALVCHPDVVYADEPTGNLDSATTKEVMNVICELGKQQNQTMFLVTHDESIAAYADRIVRIQDGQIIDDSLTGNANAAHPGSEGEDHEDA